MHTLGEFLVARMTRLARHPNSPLLIGLFPGWLMGFVFALHPQVGTCQMHPNREWMVVAYNVENLFSPAVDSMNRDTDYTPQGRYHWTKGRMRKKAQRIGQALFTLTEHHPIGLLGLSEIENYEVLDVLMRQSLLRRYCLKIIHRDSPDPRGIDVALLYNENFASLIATEWLHPDSMRQTTREMLHATFKVIGGDTLHVIQCHWPSRRNSDNASKRTRVASLLMGTLDRLKSLPKHEYIVMGDFNEGYPSPLFAEFVAPWDSVNSKNQQTIALPLNRKQKLDGVGSYKFAGVWNSIDHFFISSGLLRNAGCISIDSSYRIGTHPSLLEADTKESGLRPMRMMLGPRFRPDGASDHLPIGFLLRLNAVTGEISEEMPRSLLTNLEAGEKISTRSDTP